MKYKFVSLFLFLIAAFSFGYFQNTYAATETLHGGLSLDAYCNHLGQVNSNPINSSEWRCNPNGIKIALNQACQWQYNDLNAFGKQKVSNNPYTWECFTSSTPPSPMPSPSATPDTLSQRIKALEDLLTIQTAKLLDMQNRVATLENPLNSPRPTSKPFNTINLVAEIDGNSSGPTGTFLTWKISNPSNLVAVLDEAVLGDIPASVSGVQILHFQPFTVYNVQIDGSGLMAGTHRKLTIKYHNTSGNNFQTVYDIKLVQRDTNRFDVVGFINPLFN